MTDAIELPDGSLVDAPGVYLIDMGRYHSQICVGPSVSSSGLRTIYHQSPADFWAFSDLNDNRFEQETTPALNFGRAAHALLLGDEDFHASFAVVPKMAPPRPTSAQVAARARGNVSDSARERFDFWDVFDMENVGKDLISEAELIHIEHIADNLRDRPEATLLLDGRREHSIIWKDRTGIWIKSRLDVLSATGDIADLKTTTLKTVPDLLRETRKKGYDMQLGLATIGLEEVMGIPFDADTYAGRSAVLIYVAKAAPYHVMPVEVDFEALHFARLKCRKAIDTMAECIRTGHWPGPVEDMPVFTADYERTDLLNMQAEGKLPLAV